jgi:hypothetical protein
LAIGVFASTPTAKAQSWALIGTANVPFAFQVGSLEMPAGVYAIHRVSPYQLVLRGHLVNQSLWAHAVKTREAPDKGSMIFRRYVDTYFLEQVWEAGNNDGVEIPMSKAEKAAQIASNQKAASSSQVAFNSTPRR